MSFSVLKMTVPTYMGTEQVVYDYDNEAEVFLYERDGLRLCLGGPIHQRDRPDIVVEKIEEGWKIFIHPANCDPDYVIEIREKETRVENAGGELIHKTER